MSDAKTNQAPIHLIGVPIDAGGGRPGARSGPASLRAAGLADAAERIIDCGDVIHPDHPRGETLDKRFSLTTETAIAARDRVESSLREGAIPLTIGGDHSLSVGSLAAVARICAEAGLEAPGLLWLDAHLDLNTPDTSPTGNCHGMSAAALLGYHIPGLSEVVGTHAFFDRTRSAFIGHRDADEGERKRLVEGPYLDIPCSELPGEDLEARINRILDVVAPDGGHFCLSFDIDVMDPEYAPGIDTAVPGGLDPETAQRILACIAAHGGLVAMDLVEVNPAFDDLDRTAKLAVELTGPVIAAAQPLLARS